MTGEARRQQIIALITQAEKPLSGTALGEMLGVSRQVIVQDMALLRREGYDIMATARGYLLERLQEAVRQIKVCHSEDQTEEELNTIVDLGGAVLDVMVNHRVYGRMSAPLHIRSRRDVRIFMENLRSGKSSPLMRITSGYHFHRISADSESLLEEIVEALEKKGFLAQVLPYEKE